MRDVHFERDKETIVGTLHVTRHHLILSDSKDELKIPYPMMDVVEIQSTASDRYPLCIKCKDFIVLNMTFSKETEPQDVYNSIQKLTHIDSVEQLYAYTYQPSIPFKSNHGWTVYDPMKEYERMGVDGNSTWRFSLINKDYKYSPTYPRLLVIPSKISDNTLNYAAKYRSKARIPALSYLHWYNNASITRSSQPLVGFKQARSVQDEKLIEAIFSTNVPAGPNGEVIYGSTAANLIIDARPMANAVGNVARGAGTENMDHYRNCKKNYVAIDNIHVMRDSLNKLSEAMINEDEQLLQKSGWIRHITMILEGVMTIVKNVHVYNSHVLVHCSDGWDRTSQLVSLGELCLDPYYRTLEGFQVLIEKDWISFGHRFKDRCGHVPNDFNHMTNSIKDIFYNNYYPKETSPVFHQFLDCVYQLLRLYPTRFEFNEQLLIELHYHVYSCQFGTFLFNSEAEREKYRPQEKTYSVWDYIDSRRAEFTNNQYDPMKDKDVADDGGVLMPYTLHVIHWTSLFKRNEQLAV